MVVSPGGPVGNQPTPFMCEAAIKWKYFARNCDPCVVTSALPDGWTLERVRVLSGDETAALLSLQVVVELAGQSDYEELPPEVIIGFQGLCLVRAKGDDDWYMGQVDPDGSVICWSSYGSDLGEAIRSL
jgi:hypothetical protein